MSRAQSFEKISGRLLASLQSSSRLCATGAQTATTTAWVSSSEKSSKESPGPLHFAFLNPIAWKSLVVIEPSLSESKRSNVERHTSLSTALKSATAATNSLNEICLPLLPQTATNNASESDSLMSNRLNAF